MNSPQKRTLSKTPPSSGVINKIRNTPNKDFIPLVQGSSAKTSSSSYYGMLSTGEELRPLPKILDTGLHLREQQFRDKLKQCCNLFDFGNPLKDIVSKDVKRETLLELIDYISTESNSITDGIYQDVITMISKNLFRDLPPKVNPFGDHCDPEEDEPVLELAWPHLQLVYEFVVRFLESSEFDAKKAKKYFTKQFVSSLIKIFDSEDPRERDYLKTVLHRIYGKFLHLRPFIRKEIGDVFVAFTFGSEKFNGISEVLEILGSIINGFSVPLKTEHVDYLMKCIMPLLRVHYINGFHSQLFYCVCQFIEKEKKLAESVIKYLLKVWPITNSHKQAIFISAIDDIFYLIDLEEFKKIQIPLFKKLSKCIHNTHFQVAEKTLMLFQNEEFRNLFTLSSDTLIPIIYPVLVDVSKMYWNEGIQKLSVQIMKFLNNINAKAVEKCSSKRVDTLESKMLKQQQIFDHFDKKIQKQVFLTDEKASSPLSSSDFGPSQFDMIDPLPLPEKTYEAIQNHIIKTSTPQKKKKKSKK